MCVLTDVVWYILPIKPSLLCNRGRMATETHDSWVFPLFPWIWLKSLLLDVGVGQCFETQKGERKKERESGVLLESASQLQNETSKTNTGLKLDFPKHCIPSHFTHHRGLRTRIDSGRKIHRRSRVGELGGTFRRKKKSKKNALHRRLMKSEGRNLFICGMLRNCPAYVDFPSLRTEFQLLKKLFFFSLDLLLFLFQLVMSNQPLFPSSVLPWAPTHSSDGPGVLYPKWRGSWEQGVVPWDSGTLLAGGSATLNSLAEVKVKMSSTFAKLKVKSRTAEKKMNFSQLLPFLWP